MLYGQFIDDLAARLKQTVTDTGVRTVLGRKVNQSYKEIANAYDWVDLKRTGETFPRKRSHVWSGLTY